MSKPQLYLIRFV